MWIALIFSENRDVNIFLAEILTICASGDGVLALHAEDSSNV